MRPTMRKLFKTYKLKNVKSLLSMIKTEKNTSPNHLKISQIKNNIRAHEILLKYNAVVIYRFKFAIHQEITSCFSLMTSLKCHSSSI